MLLPPLLLLVAAGLLLAVAALIWTWWRRRQPQQQQGRLPMAAASQQARATELAAELAIAPRYSTQRTARPARCMQHRIAAAAAARLFVPVTTD